MLQIKEERKKGQPEIPAESLLTSFPPWIQLPHGHLHPWPPLPHTYVKKAFPVYNCFSLSSFHREVSVAIFVNARMSWLSGDIQKAIHSTRNLRRRPQLVFICFPQNIKTIVTSVLWLFDVGQDLGHEYEQAAGMGWFYLLLNLQHLQQGGHPQGGWRIN